MTDEDTTKVVRLDDVRRSRAGYATPPSSRIFQAPEDVVLDSYDDPEGAVAHNVMLVERNGVRLVALLTPAGFDAEGIALSPADARTIAIALIELARQTDNENQERANR